MGAVVHAPPVGRTRVEPPFAARARHGVEPDRIDTLAIAGERDRPAPRVPELGADLGRVDVLPGVVADGAPLARVEDLDASLPVRGRTDEPDLALGRRRAADDPRVLDVRAEVHAPARRAALVQPLRVVRAGDLAEPDRIDPLAERGQLDRRPALVA